MGLTDEQILASLVTRYSCPICERGGLGAANMKLEHLKMAHNIQIERKGKLYHCLLCGTKYGGVHDLIRRHFRVDKEAKTAVPLCQKPGYLPQAPKPEQPEPPGDNGGFENSTLALIMELYNEWLRLIDTVKCLQATEATLNTQVPLLQNEVNDLRAEREALSKSLGIERAEYKKLRDDIQKAQVARAETMSLLNRRYEK